MNHVFAVLDCFQVITFVAEFARNVDLDNRSREGFFFKEEEEEEEEESRNNHGL